MNETTLTGSAPHASLTDADSSASTAVLGAVADAKGIAPVDIREPLYAVVDAEALDRLVDSMDHAPTACVEFTYCGFDVTVAGDGSVSLDETTRA